MHLLYFLTAFTVLASVVTPKVAVAATHEQVVKVAAVAQYTDGEIVKTEASGVVIGEVAYQTPIYEGDRIETKRGSASKFITRSGCVFVLRGEGSFMAPQDKPTSDGKHWRLRAESVRLICTNHQSEVFVINSVNATVSNGEVLFTSGKVLLLAGAALLNSKPLELHKLYSVEGLSPAEPQPNEEDLRKFNLDQKPPREAYRWPEPDKKPTFRAIFGDAFNRASVHYSNKDLDQSSIKGDGPRLQFHFKTNSDKAFIVLLQHPGSDNQSQSGSSNSPPPDGVTNNLEATLLEFGQRAHFDRWWSTYWRAGGGFDKAKINSFIQNQGSSYYTYEFYVLTATYGIDASLAPHFLRPVGLYLSLESELMQSIARGGRINEGAGFSGNNNPSEPWSLTQFNVNAYLGVQLYF